MKIQQLRIKNKEKLHQKFVNYPSAERINELYFECFIQDYLAQNNDFNVYETDDNKFDFSCNLIRDDLFEFVKTSQNDQWIEYSKLYSSNILENKFIEELDKAINKKGLSDVLRNGFAINNLHFDIFGKIPTNNDSSQLEYQNNIFSCISEFYYTKTEQYKNNRIDLVLFINGFPLITIELKSTPNQNVQAAIDQYKHDRQASEKFFKENYRTLVHFAMSDDLVYFTTKLADQQTKFLPFNKGSDNHAGNPVVTGKYKTHYMWEEIFKKDALLDIFQNFVFKVKERTDEGNDNSFLLWPRYHQLYDIWKTRNELTKQSKDEWWKSKHHFLFANAPGSGKTHEIGWLAFLLAKLKDQTNANYFDSVIIITDRKVVDQQLQNEIIQLNDVYHNGAAIDYVKLLDQKSTAADLKRYLKNNARIIVTTLHKFSHIKGCLNTSDTKYAVIIDEAHSSTSSELKKNMEHYLHGGYKELESIENKIGEVEKQILTKEINNIVYFPFTATPKPITKRLFGIKTGLDKYEDWACYSIQQAIEEGFILDVLQHVMIYQLSDTKIKRVTSENPTLPVDQTTRKIREKIIRCSVESITEKAKIIANNFPFTLASLNGLGKAMIVAPSITGVITYKKVLEKMPKFKGMKILVAFTGKSSGKTEADINGFNEGRTADEFKKDQNRILIVCNKFQTGFDEPRLTTLFVDQPLAGVRAVQTYSRLNRIKDNKETLIVDFVNPMEDIKNAFTPYFVPTELTSLYDAEEFNKCIMMLKKENFYTDNELDTVIKNLLKIKSSYQANDSDDKLVEMKNLISEIYYRIDNHQKYTPVQIDEFIKKIKYFVKWYPVVHSLYSVDYESECILYKMISKKFIKTKDPWDPTGKVAIENVVVKFVAEYKENVIVPVSKTTLMTPKLGHASIGTIEECLDEIINSINSFLDPNGFPKEIESEIRIPLSEFIENILADQENLMKIQDQTNDENSKKRFLVKALQETISEDYAKTNKKRLLKLLQPPELQIIASKILMLLLSIPHRQRPHE